MLQTPNDNPPSNDNACSNAILYEEKHQKIHFHLPNNDSVALQFNGTQTLLLRFFDHDKINSAQSWADIALRTRNENLLDNTALNCKF